MKNKIMSGILIEYVSANQYDTSNSQHILGELLGNLKLGNLNWGNVFSKKEGKNNIQQCNFKPFLLGIHQYGVKVICFSTSSGGGKLF